MPTWNVHLAIAKRIAKELDIKDKDAFMLGNFLPDHEKFDKKITHYLGNKQNQKDNLPSCDEFVKKYKDNMTNPVVLGYLVHLLTDYYFNKVTFNNCYIYDENNKLIGIKLKNGKNKYSIDAKSITKIKHSDFEKFGEYLAKNKYITVPKYVDYIDDLTKDIDEVKVTDSDMLTLVKFLEKNMLKYHKIIRKKYYLYTKKLLMEHFELCVKYILEYITDKNINYRGD